MTARLLAKARTSLGIAGRIMAARMPEVAWGDEERPRLRPLPPPRARLTP